MLALAAAGAGCLFAPDAPDGGGEVIESRCLDTRDSAAGATSIAVQDGALDSIVRLGVQDGVAVLWQFGPDKIGSNCPSSVTRLQAGPANPDLDAFALGIRRVDSTRVHFYVLAASQGSSTAEVHDLTSESSTPDVYTDRGTITSEGSAPTAVISSDSNPPHSKNAFVSYVKTGDQVWFGGGAALAAADVSQGFAGTALPRSSDLLPPEHFYGVVSTPTAPTPALVVGAESVYGARLAAGLIETSSNVVIGDCEGTGVCSDRMFRPLSEPMGGSGSALVAFTMTRRSREVGPELHLIDIVGATHPFDLPTAGTGSYSVVDADLAPDEVNGLAFAALWRDDFSTSLPAPVPSLYVYSLDPNSMSANEDAVLMLGAAPDVNHVVIVRDATGLRVRVLTPHPGIGELCFTLDGARTPSCPLILPNQRSPRS